MRVLPPCISSLIVFFLVAPDLLPVLASPVPDVAAALESPLLLPAPTTNEPTPVRIAARQPSRRMGKRKEKKPEALQKKDYSAFLCPELAIACPVVPDEEVTDESIALLDAGLNTLADWFTVGFECVDLATELNQCGGCLALGAGMDCSIIPNARGTGCENSECRVYSCFDGYVVSPDRGSCVKKGTTTPATPVTAFGAGEAEAAQQITSPYEPEPELEPQVLLLLVGLPGSGKTTLALALEGLGLEHGHGLEPGLGTEGVPAPSSTVSATASASASTRKRLRRWVRASQDDAPSKRRQEVEGIVRNALVRGDNVVVDRCGFSPAQRAHFIAIAQALNDPLAPPFQPPPPPPAPPASSTPAILTTTSTLDPHPRPTPTGRAIQIHCLILPVSPPTLSARLTARPSHPTLTTPAHALAVLAQMTREWDPPHPARVEGLHRVLVLWERDQPAGGHWGEEALRGLLWRIANEGGVEQGRSVRGRDVRAESEVARGI